MSIDSVNMNSSMVLMLHDQEAIATEMGGDLDAQIAALMLKQAQDDREMLHTSRDAVEKQISANEAEQVAELRKKADETRKAAMAGAWATIGTGVVKVMDGAGQLDTGSKTSDASMTLGKGGTEIGTGISKMIGAEHEHAADCADANAVAAEHRADEAKRTLEDLRDEQREARDLARNAMDSLAETTRTRASTYQAALFQRV